MKCCDFRKLNEQFDQTFDCVASTGNSLPYVSNDAVLQVLEQMDALVKKGGYLYFDTRNWDRILQEKQRFYLYNPMFDGDTRINLVQVWDYPDEHSMVFNLLYTFEKDNRIFQKEHFEEHYFPISKQLLLNKLDALGYREVELYRFPACFGEMNFEQDDWYCVIAQKCR